MRKVFLDELPKIKGSKKNISWLNSIGCKVPFIYDDIQGFVEIVGYKTPHVLIKYKNYIIRS